MASKPRVIIDCRLYPSDKNCDLAISGSEPEVLDTAVQHAVAKHGHKDSPDLRDQLRKLLKAES